MRGIFCSRPRLHLAAVTDLSERRTRETRRGRSSQVAGSRPCSFPQTQYTHEECYETGKRSSSCRVVHKSTGTASNSEQQRACSFRCSPPRRCPPERQEVFDTGSCSDPIVLLLKHRAARHPAIIKAVFHRSYFNRSAECEDTSQRPYHESVQIHRH